MNNVIEYNQIENSGAEGIVKQPQAIGSRIIEWMPKAGLNTIRNNVVSKNENNGLYGPVPNISVGTYPAWGDGSNDHYAVYGNLLWQNPSEALFYGKGNIGFYNNLVINF